ncbi:hypothetical protein [Methylobacter sp.]|uniref:hypothetical protein n=1 Tax=Methylobacter sp. TaxID=2051955 RepID=UPI002FDE486D
MDSQSVKKWDQEVNAVFTPVKRLKEENAISSSIAWKICWRYVFIQGAYKIGTVLGCS